MVSRLVTRLASIVGILSVAGVLLGCNTSDDKAHETTGVFRQWDTALRPVHWKTNGKPIGRTIRIRSDVDYCDGSPVPRIQRIRVDEHARKVLLTAMLTTSVRPTGVACADVRIGVHKTVTLKRDLAGRTIYDASFSPPRKRWPR